MPRVPPDKTGSTWNYYVYGTSLIGKVGSDNVARYYHLDGTGHVRAITDSTGAVVERYDYDAFGALRNTPTGLANDRRFTGEQHDAETAYTFLRARYYDPTLGRFISKDPLSGSKKNPQTLNQYIYTTNNPVHKVDPSGMIEAVLPTPGCAYSSADICDGIGGGGNPIIPVILGGLIYYYDEVTGALINVIEQTLEGLGTLLSSDSTPNMTPHVTEDYLRNRGWDAARVQEALDNPTGKHPGTSTRDTGSPTTIHPHPDGGYVATNDDTGEVIGVSNQNRPDWIEPNAP